MSQSICLCVRMCGFAYTLCCTYGARWFIASSLYRHRARTHTQQAVWACLLGSQWICSWKHSAQAHLFKSGCFDESAVWVGVAWPLAPRISISEWPAERCSQLKLTHSEQIEFTILRWWVNICWPRRALLVYPCHWQNDPKTAELNPIAVPRPTCCGIRIDRMAKVIRMNWIRVQLIVALYLYCAHTRARMRAQRSHNAQQHFVVSNGFPSAASTALSLSTEHDSTSR